MTNSITKRWVYLIAGVFTMLFSRILYAWSILKIPFKVEFNWSDSALALNFTLTMCFFCLGAFFGSLVCKKAGPKIALIIAGVFTGVGFVSTGFLNANSLYFLFVTYAVLAGMGIGICYNVVVSTVTLWFPDRKGFCTGCLMMGFGLSTLLLGNIIDSLFNNASFGWSKTYIVVGVVIALVQIIVGLILRRPDENTVLPQAKIKKSANKEDFEVRDFTPVEMIKTFTFWRAFVCVAFITAVGNSVISFTRDLAISVEASPDLATTLVGVLAICNGFSRVLTGVVYDVFGRKTTMLSASILTIVAAGVTLIAVGINSLPLCIAGLCLTGFSYGSCPTVTSTFASGFYGQKHFAVNYSIINSNLIFASFIATASNELLISSGSYTAPFIMLLTIAIVALGLTFTIRRP